MSDVEVAGLPRRVRRRRRRAAITLGVLVLFLAGSFWYAWSYWNSGHPSATSASPTPTCRESARVAPEKIEVDVYNSTNRQGLATRTARKLRARGYTIARIANDPRKGETIKGTAVIRYGKKGAERAKSLRHVVPGAKMHRGDRSGARVELVLGLKFEDLGPEPAPRCPTS